MLKWRLSKNAATIGGQKIAALSSTHIAKYRDGRLKVVAGRLARSPQGAKPRDRRLVGDEAQRLLSACADAHNPFLLRIVKLAIETAMRQGEIVSLDWKHVDLNKPSAYLPETKNGESRGVPLSTTAVAIIRADS